jgi:hypothetical protein
MVTIHTVDSVLKEYHLTPRRIGIIVGVPPSGKSGMAFR